MKKLMVLVMVLALTLFLAGCGDKTEAPTGNAVQPTVPTVAVEVTDDTTAPVADDTPTPTAEAVQAQGTECGSVNDDLQKYCKCDGGDLEEKDGKLYCNGVCSSCRCVQNNKFVPCP